MRALALTCLFASGLAGCYGHRAAHTPARVAAAGLPKARQGHYELWRAGRRIGTERLVVTATRGWTLRGEVEWTRPVPARARYRLALEDDEPRALEVRLELMDQVRTLSATVAGGFVHASVSGVGRALSREVAYGAGTMLDSSTPALRMWVLGLLSPRLLPGARIDVRTVRFAPPAFAPDVELQTLAVQDARGDVRLVRLERPGSAPPEALWVGPDGFVLRARTWPQGPRAPFVERRWVDEAAAGSD